MPNTLEEKDWNLLLKRIKEGKCTPFIGAGACFGKIPLGGDIAHDWAQKNDYPLEDCRDLARVAQFLAVTEDAMSPKEKMRDTIAENVKAVTSQYFEVFDEPHGVLAGLPLPVYITTNYDNFMVRALEGHNKKFHHAMCCWNNYLTQKFSSFKQKQTNVSIPITQSNISQNAVQDFNPIPESPVVFHLHGYYEVPESMVITEDDYLEFLVNISKEQQLLPPRIQEAFTGASVLFLGYRIADWNFRVLFRMLTDYLGKNLTRAHISVQLPPIKPDFHENEFSPSLSIEKLCKVIHDEYPDVQLQSPENTISRLNEFLAIPDFYDIFTAKNPECELTTEIGVLARKMNDHRKKEFSHVEYTAKNDIKRLNRLILREAYPKYIPENREEKAQKYLNRYFGDQKIRVYWGNCREFAADLRTRWEAFQK